MNLTDLPNTPREQFEALSGKRPDLILTPTRGQLGFATMDAGEESPGLFFGLWGGSTDKPLAMLVGGLN